MIRLRLQTPAGMEFDATLAPDVVIFGATVGPADVTLTEAVPGDDDLDLAVAIVRELADLDLAVLSAEVRGVPMSSEWLDEHAATQP